MIKSMTGYGAATVETDRISVSVEIKTLNSKFLDLNLRISKEYTDKEVDIRSMLIHTIERGKVSLTIEVKNKAETKPKITINKNLLKYYYQELSGICDELGAPKDSLFSQILTLPDVLANELSSGTSQEDWECISSAILKAIEKCNEFRCMEGKVIEQHFLEYLERIEKKLFEIETQDPIRIANIRNKIHNSFNELNITEIDPARFEQELIYYIEKLDISEEKVRLKSHIQYFRETLKTAESNGKKLSFIAQEIGREINTIGSKSNDAIIQKCVVDMKDELEKIKEQAQNIL
ncbi:MAG: YicC family protein [Cytophagaceae bacterium]|nr:YicC family protein [Cytophagaceae bacterium]MDW8456750.1 YicC/YloC family endoribonuclease [Cytophagaceae bacterium]